MPNSANTPENSNSQVESPQGRRRRRRFSRKQKLAILAAADLCSGVADLAALLAREGVFSSHLTVWRKQLRKQEQQAAQRAEQPADKKVETTAVRAMRDPMIDRLEHENAKLQRELLAANNVIELQRTMRGTPSDFMPRADAGK